MCNENCSFPYPIGTYLISNEKGADHLDQVTRYIFDKNGLSVILTLDAVTDPRLSAEIRIDELLEKWEEVPPVVLTGNDDGIGTKILIHMPSDKGSGL